VGTPVPTSLGLRRQAFLRGFVREG
jgi:hypothetical protein